MNDCELAGPVTSSSSTTSRVPMVSSRDSQDVSGLSRLVSWAHLEARRVAACCALSVFMAAASIAGASAPAPRRPSSRIQVPPFPISTPEEQGMDSDALADAVEELVDTRHDFRPHRVIVIRHGHAVLDVSFFPFSGGVRHDISSAGKVITCTLIGIAIDKGFIGSVDDTVLSYFPDREIANRDARKEAITIAHLLAQRSGLDLDRDVMEAVMTDCPDRVQCILDRPMVSEPGGAYYYSNHNPHLAAAILTQATGMTPLEFAEEHLLGPMGFSRVDWKADDQGVNEGGGGQVLLPTDFAKLGALYLSGGEWRDTQIVSAGWVAMSLTPYPGPPVPNWPPEVAPGFHWAVFTDIGVMEAAGSAGQIVRIEPDNDLILAVVAGGGPGYSTCNNNGALLQWLAPRVSEAILSWSALAANPEGVARLISLAEAAALADPGSLGPVTPLPPIAHTISGRRFALEANPLDLEWFSLTFPGGSEAVLGYRDPEATVSVRMGLDNVYRVSPGKDNLPFAAKGRWADDGRFVGVLDQVPLYTTYETDFQFEDDQVTVTVLETGCGDSAATLVGHLEP
jgi:CubicO group peptidase (beta-lactamase class C family)